MPTPVGVTTANGFSEDATTVLGLAGTAMAFAGSRQEEVERWLRALRLYGEAGATLRAVGLDEASDAGAAPVATRPFPDAAADPDTLACIITCAEQFALQRHASAVGTVDLLFAVMRVYGEAFDHALALRGTDRNELVERLGAGLATPSA